jgi:hypothetical protein
MITEPSAWGGKTETAGFEVLSAATVNYLLGSDAVEMIPACLLGLLFDLESGGSPLLRNQSGFRSVLYGIISQMLMLFLLYPIFSLLSLLLKSKSRPMRSPYCLSVSVPPPLLLRLGRSTCCLSICLSVCLSVCLSICVSHLIFCQEAYANLSCSIYVSVKSRLDISKLRISVCEFLNVRCA